MKTKRQVKTYRLVEKLQKCVCGLDGAPAGIRTRVSGSKGRNTWPMHMHV